MQENVVEKLQQFEANDKTKQKMVDILRRFHSEQEVDDLKKKVMLTNVMIFVSCDREFP